MKLQEKTSLILVVLLILVISLISIFVSAISLSSDSSLEHKYVIQETGQVAGNLNTEFASLSAITSGWGPWNDTYNFVIGNEPDYIRTNLVPETYHNLRLDVIAITNRDGDVVYAGAYDQANHLIVAVPESFRQQLSPGNPLMNMTDPHHSVTGILVVDKNPLLVASQPVIHSDFSGTPDGVVIVGRYLHENELAGLGSPASPSVRVLSVGDPVISPSLLSQIKDDAAEGTDTVVPLDYTTVAGYTPIRDIYGNDAFVLQVVQPRDIYQQGVTMTFYYILIVLGSGLLFGIIVLLLLDRLVLSRVSSLSLQVYTIGRDEDISRRMVIDGNDEFTGLAVEINHMLETLESTQKGLQESEGRFRELAELLPLIVFEMDTAGNLKYVNKAGVERFGITEQKILKGINIRDYLSPDNIEMMQHGLSTVISGGKSPGEIYTLKQFDGNLMRAIVYTSLIYREGKITGFRGIVLDISERIRLEEALTESEEYLRALIRSIRVGIFVIDTKTHRVIDVNPAALEMMGTGRDAVINQLCHEVICPAEVGRCPITDLNQAVDNAERTLLTPDGREISVIKYVVPLMLHGKPCLLETFIDNTYRKQIERKLAENEEKYRALAENSADIIFSLDMEGICTYISPQVNTYGFLEDEITGKPIRNFIHPEDIDRVEQDLARDLEKGAQFHSTFRTLDKWGNVNWFDEKGTLRLDQSGKPIGIYGVLRDVTEQKRAKDAIELANKKLNLMNNITRHDILNTITGLLGCVDMANATTTPEGRDQLLRDIRELTRVIQWQISFTKEYQEVGVHLPLWQNVTDVIQRILVNFEKSGLQFIIDLEKTEIYADPLLEKVFYNLVDNAIRYGEKVTTITFYFQISDKGLSLTCEDDGAGIPSEQKRQIFERGVGRNTGMGLFLTREILAITGITIVENGVYGKGARFEIHIPRGTFRFVR